MTILSNSFEEYSQAEKKINGKDLEQWWNLF